MKAIYFNIKLTQTHTHPRTGIESKKLYPKRKRQQQRRQPCTRKSKMKLSGKQKQNQKENDESQSVHGTKL